MHNVYFEDFEDLVCDVADKYDSINKLEEYKDVAVIAKYEEARQIIKELMCIGYDLHSIVMHDVEYDGYEFEYIISLYDDEIWVEPMMRESGYITDDSPIMYVLDNCSSNVIPYCKGKTVFEVTVGDEEYDCDECGCVCKEETNDKIEHDIKSDDDGYSITVRCNLDADEAMKVIKDMENRMERMNDMFREMDYFRRLFRW